MRARLALWASDTLCEVREVILANKPQALLQASPKGTVPVLVLPSGQVLEQSLDIMRWALHRDDPQHWLPKTAGEREQTLALIAQCDGDFKGNLDRYKYPNRYALTNGLAYRSQGATFMQTLHALLQNQIFLHGEHWGLADAAIAPFVRQFAHTDPTWFACQPWPELQQWLAAFETSQAFLGVMDKLPAWTESPTVQN
jgi:glutathione S-transferase